MTGRQGTRPHGYTTWQQYLDEDAAAHAAAQQEEYRRWKRAMRLAPTPDIYLALLRDEPVPVEALDPEWARRYGL